MGNIYFNKKMKSNKEMKFDSNSNDCQPNKSFNRRIPKSKTSGRQVNGDEELRVIQREVIYVIGLDDSIANQDL